MRFLASLAHLIRGGQPLKLLHRLRLLRVDVGVHLLRPGEEGLLKGSLIRCGTHAKQFVKGLLQGDDGDMD